MRHLVVREHTRIVRWSQEGSAPSAEGQVYLERRLYNRLKRFDQRQRDEADRVFSWGDGSAREHSSGLGSSKYLVFRSRYFPKWMPQAPRARGGKPRGTTQPALHARRRR